MKLVYPDLNLKIDFEETRFYNLVIENQALFYDLVQDLYFQTEGEKGKFVLSEDSAPIEIRKYAELITQWVPFSVNRKNLLSGLYGELKKFALNETMIEKTYTLLSELERYLGNLTDPFLSELEYDSETDITPLLKMFNLRFSSESGGTLCERLLDFIDASERYVGKQLFILVNFRSYVVDREAELFFKNILMRKSRLLCLEGSCRDLLKNEKRIIIDRDLCVI